MLYDTYMTIFVLCVLKCLTKWWYFVCVFWQVMVHGCLICNNDNFTAFLVYSLYFGAGILTNTTGSNTTGSATPVE